MGVLRGRTGKDNSHISLEIGDESRVLKKYK
jgi:hypothetical protein